MNYCVGDELFLSDKESSIILRVVPHIANRTNADRIRAMSDKELAELIVSIKDCHHCPIGVAGKRCHEICDTPESLLDWLQQPAPEEGEQHV